MNFGLSTTFPYGNIIHSKSTKSTSHLFRPETLEVDIAQLFDQPKKLSYKYNLLSLVGCQSHQNQNLSNNGNVNINVGKNNNVLNKRPHTTRPENASAEAQDKITSKDVKPKFPDIQMINKYYGLVPKKFTVHSRQSLEQVYTGRKLRAKSAFIPSSKSKSKASSNNPSSPSSSESNPDSVDRRKSRSRHNHHHNGKANTFTTSTNGAKGKAPLIMQMNHSSQSVSDESSQPVHLQTRKLPVERQNRLLKNRGRSSSLPVNLTEDLSIAKTKTKREESKSRFDKERQQRTIRIDLHKMSWEEGCSSCSQEVSSRSPSLDSLEDDELSKQEEDDNDFPELRESRESLEQEIGSANDGELTKTKNANILAEDDSNSSALHGVKALLPSGEEEKVSGRMRKCLKKTASFDEQVLLGKDGSEKDKCYRPMTAATSNLKTHPNPVQVLPWTQKSGKTLSLSERRAKFQRSVSIQSHSSTDKETTPTSTTTSNTSMSISNSLDYGEECSDSEMMTNFVSKSKIQSGGTAIGQPLLSLPGRNSSAYKETKKSLFFQPAPEVSTLVSQISPIDNLDVQVEIEKVAVMLSQNKTFSSNAQEGEDEASRARDVNGNVVGESSGKPFKTSFDDSPKVHSSFQRSLSISSDPAKTAKILPANSHNYPGSEALKGSQSQSQPQKPGQFGPMQNNGESRPRPILKKAVSISCESELGAKASGERNNGTVTANGISSHTRSFGFSSRPKTALLSSKQPPQPLKLQRHSSSPSLMGEKHKSNDSQKPQASKEKLVQGQGKKVMIKKALMEINQASVQLRTKRPKTAPNEARKGKGRLPLKVSPAPLIMVGNKSKSVLGTKAIPPLAMGRSKQGQGGSSGHSQSESQDASSKSPNFEGSLHPPSGNLDRRKLQRQSFSLDEGMLLSFSNKEFGWAEEEKAENPPEKEKDSRLSGLGESSSGSNDGIHEAGNDKKREQCLKIYQKMLKSGMNVKLDTIFRGMMTPSEYRAFIKAAEAAAKQLALEEEERKEKELEARKARRGKLMSEGSEDAGVFKPEVSENDSEVKC